MSRRKKVLMIFGALAAAVLVLAIAAVAIVQTEWFREYVKNKIVAATESGTGGKVEIGSYAFDWKHLHSTVTNFVIHGNEPPGAPPYLRADRVDLDIRLFASIHHLLDVRSLVIDRPRANIMILADGRTNVPSPRTNSQTSQTPLQTVVDLAVGHFALNDGQIVFASQKQNLNVRGDNLRMNLAWNTVAQEYQGRLQFSPIYVIAGQNTPIQVALDVPVTLHGNEIELRTATLSTARSSIALDGSIKNLQDPRAEAHVAGHIALADLKAAGVVSTAGDASGPLSGLKIDAAGAASGNSVNVTRLNLSLGQSSAEAFGTLKGGGATSALTFNTKLVVGELSRLAGVANRPDGVVVLNGTAKLEANNDYRINGKLQADRISFQQGGRRISGINLRSAVAMTPHEISLSDAQLTVFGAEIRAEAAMQNFTRYRVKGNLNNLSSRAIAQALGYKQFALDGIVSGPLEAAGDLQVGRRETTAHAVLSIGRGTHGVPITGKIDASYSGGVDDLSVQNSYVALPHTRLTMSGSVRKRLDAMVTSSDLNDVLESVSSSPSPVTFNGGGVTFAGAVTGGLSSPQISGHLAANRFRVEGRAFDRLDADAALSKNGAAVRNGSLTRGGMRAQISAAVGLRDWIPAPDRSLAADVSVENGDLADLLALAGRASADSSGLLTATGHLTGTVGNPRGNGTFQVAKGSFEGQPFDRIQARVDLTDQRIVVPNASVETSAGRADFRGEFQHPRDSLTTGQIQARLQSTPIDLAKLAGLQQRRPGTAGVVEIAGDVAGTISHKSPGGSSEIQFLLTNVTANSSVRGLRVEGQSYGDLTASARTTGETVSYNVTSDFAGSTVKMDGNTKLSPGYPSTGEASIAKLPVERVLALARRNDIRARGELSGTARFSGTLENPQGDADFTLVRAALYDEPIDRLRARVAYRPQNIEIQEFQVASGDSHVDMTAQFTHPQGEWSAGDFQFHVNNGRIDLQRIKTVQNRRPGLGGVIQLAANGAGQIQAAEPRLRLRDFNADAAAKDVVTQGVKLGDASLKAATSSGKLNFTLDSNLAMATIHGQGNATLSGEYPMDAQVSFSNLAWSRVRSLLPANEAGGFEAVADGQITARGPALNAGLLSGSVQLSRLQVYGANPGGRSRNRGPSSSPAPQKSVPQKPVPQNPLPHDPLLQNQGPIAVTLDHGMIRVQSAHVTGPQTDLQIAGTAPLRGDGLNLTVNGDADLALLQTLSPDIESSGALKLAATARGALNNPRVTGQIDLHNGTLNYSDLGNGLANANGTVLFNGNTATIRNLTAESGGGKLTVNGFLAVRDNVRFGIRASASNVRVRVQQGVSVVAGGDVNLTGTLQSSLLSGNVNLSRISYAPQTDLASILGQAPTLVETGGPSLLDHVKLDVRVKSESSTAVQSSLAENLNFDADLQVIGTASHPGALGRVTCNEGQLALFGSTYTVDSGSVGFYNPARIDPVLDLNLETEAKGVTVTLRVDGPMDNLKLSYSSDPPLQFQEIVSLLAAGATPTSDPTLLANQPAQPQQNFQQMGASALLGKAVADPVANRLQRVFGVSQLKIDPSFTNGSEVPQAKLTLQQRVTTNVMFTYVTGVSDANAQTIRVQWTFNPQWAATAMRDQNGIVSLNLVYKRQIR